MLRIAATVGSCLFQGTSALAYNESRAIQFANLAGASYCRAAQIQAWDCGAKCDAIKGVSSIKVCDASATQAFVALWEGTCIVSFKGTNNPIDVVKDIDVGHKTMPWDSCPGCDVHAGFLLTYTELRACVIESLRKNGCSEGSAIRTTGHSLGAAVSALAMIDLAHAGWTIEESYDFGRPRVGGEVFASTFNTRFGENSWRITHKKDPVPMVPYYLVDLHWTHTEPEVHYKGALSGGYEMCTDPNDHTHCIEQYSVNPVFILDHEHYMDVSIGTTGCSLTSSEIKV